MKHEKTKTKRKIKPPPLEKRCTYIITQGKSAGQQCPKAKQKDREFCNMHPPERAREMGKKGGATTAARWSKVKAARAAARKRWPVGQSWDAQIKFLEENIGLAMDTGTKAGKIEAQMAIG